MWHLNLDRLRGLVPGGSLGEIAVETGTCRGNGTRKLAENFPRVITIELSLELYRLATGNFPAYLRERVEFRQGNSAEELARILPTLPVAPIFFFLDAHWSGDQTVDWRASAWKGYGLDTAHLGPDGSLPTSRQQCPLEEELRAIMKYCRGPALVLIDDIGNLPPAGGGTINRGFPGEDWSHLSRQSLLGIASARLTGSHLLENPAQQLLLLSAQPTL